MNRELLTKSNTESKGTTCSWLSPDEYKNTECAEMRLGKLKPAWNQICQAM